MLQVRRGFLHHFSDEAWASSFNLANVKSLFKIIAMPGLNIVLRF